MQPSRAGRGGGIHPNTETVPRYKMPTEGLCGCESSPLSLGTGLVTLWASVLGTLLPGGLAAWQVPGIWPLSSIREAA